MSDREPFLTRWSRRKRDAASVASEHSDQAAGKPAPESAAEKNADTPSPAERKSEAAETFDLAQLPPIDSITAETDIREFLMPGVPAALRQAALRRVWAADPTIRDFVGLADYDWDFNASGIAGFDLSPPDGDIKKMVAEIFGEHPAGEERKVADAQDRDDSAQEPESAPESGIASHRNVKECPAADTPPESGEQQDETAVQSGTSERRSADTAAQENDAMQYSDDRRPSRQRGRAVPR